MKNNPILLCFGTRPEWLKVKPLIDIMDRSEYKLLFTGQHTDLLKNVEVDYSVNISSEIENRLDAIIVECMLQFPTDEFSGVMVQGDTASSFACGLAAYHRQLKIYYMEAGLRSGNLEHPYPEEGYRQMLSRISDVNFAPTQLSFDNLKIERTLGTTHIVGNSVLDNLLEYGEGNYEDIVLVTLHRRENHHWMADWFKEINDIAGENPQLNFVIPIHPNPNVLRHSNLLTNVSVVNPLPHNLLINTLKKSRLVISDSGGLQEEGSFFNKKVIVCRTTTERPEGIETGHLHMCYSPSELKGIFNEINNNPEINEPCPYGDGKASEKIYKILKDDE
jgi:UDP-N-acetylglucosamine 2-epimerase (non-hydrolysing)